MKVPQPALTVRFPPTFLSRRNVICLHFPSHSQGVTPSLPSEQTSGSEEDKMQPSISTSMLQVGSEAGSDGSGSGSITDDGIPLGDDEGPFDGSLDGPELGALESSALGPLLGISLGPVDGAPEGSMLLVGAGVADEGIFVRSWLGIFDGSLLVLGFSEGLLLRDNEGIFEGSLLVLGFSEGLLLGDDEGKLDGSLLGDDEGFSDGVSDGTSLGSGSGMGSGPGMGLPPVQLGPSIYVTQFGLPSALQLPALRTTAILPPMGLVTFEKVSLYCRTSLSECSWLSLTPVTQVVGSHATFVSAASVPPASFGFLMKLSRQHPSSNATVTGFGVKK